MEEGEVWQLRSDNERLRAQLESQERELATLRQIADAVAAESSLDVRESKIVELSKKNRALNLAYERERSKAAKLKAQLEATQILLQTEKEALGRTGDARGVSAEQAEALSRAASEWKDRCNQAHQRLAESQTALAAQKADVARLQRALQREVGEDTPLSRVLDEQSDWRGRAQQISLLKDRIRDLKLRVDEGSTSSRATTRITFDDIHREQLGGLEKDKRKEYDRVVAEAASLKSELASLKQRSDATVARKNILETEVRNLKDKLAVVLTKTLNDDRLITALRAELAAAKKALSEEAASAARNPVMKSKDEKLAAAYSELRHKCSEQEVCIEKQSQLIKQLQEVCEQKLATPSPTSCRRDIHDLRRLEVEKEKLEELVALLKDQQKETEQQKEDLARHLHLERLRAIDLEKRCEAIARPLSRHSSP